MKKIKAWKHEKEFDTKTLITNEDFSGADIAEKSAGSPDSTAPSDASAESEDVKTTKNKETREAVNLKTLSTNQTGLMNQKGVSMSQENTPGLSSIH